MKRHIDNINSHRTGVSTFTSHTSTSTSTDQSLQKSFHLSHSDKIEFKKISSPSENKKYATAQPDKTKTVKRSIDNGLKGRWTRTTGYKTGLAKVAVQCSADTFVVNQNLVLRINICGENRHCAKRQNVGSNARTTQIQKKNR